MKIFIFISVASGTFIGRNVSNYAYNPACPTENAAINCENDCISANVECIQNCNGSQDCMRQCSRDFGVCSDDCPCYANCYNGCPCSYESEYCEACESRFEDEHVICRKINMQHLDMCLDKCETFDKTCENDCFVEYHYETRYCPCMDYCPNGCPCDGFDCNSKLNSTDSVFGRKSLGILETGKTYNGECINRAGVNGSTIWIDYRDYYTYNSTHIEDCSNFCKRPLSSGDDITWTGSTPVWYPLQTTGYPTTWPARYPNTEITGTSGTTDWWYSRSSDKKKEAADLPEIQANGQQEFQYFGWENNRRTCWCGNTSPTEHLPMRDCEMKYWGASKIYTISNAKQFCEFDIIKGSYYDDYELVRRIQSSPNGYGNYKNNQQCWASFKCPSDHTVYWRRVRFNTESRYDKVTFYRVNTKTHIKYDGNYGSSSTWYSLGDSEITFEFKTDGSFTYSGFEILLRCRKF